MIYIVKFKGLDWYKIDERSYTKNKHSSKIKKFKTLQEAQEFAKRCGVLTEIEEV